ncbi:glutamate racemase [Acinetobacter sp. B5B]|uniref:glutamate racemase n=1 Tax=Acinetobacter baretiae TaxID=2605383 RepID=UPI0018C1F36C|nr:glutamate racemase [Acinetobacter baretiae]MBF7682284.1 glutamate racemase [Acinetobacter baretiae]MBF7685112.1 glutamate racemase [Acinetobacter baretiae]
MMNSISSVVVSVSKQSPIGVFDSGVGGLSVVKEICEYLPHEQIIYLADTAHVPYGIKTDEEIRALTSIAVEWLYQQGCKIVVVACNTASAFSLDFLRQKYGERFPIIGLVPALKPAVLNTKTKKVAVLATPATFRGKLIQDVVEYFAKPQGVEVMTVTCLELVPIVEAGQQYAVETQELLQRILSPVMAKGADYLVLGCTHYPFLRPSIDAFLLNQMTIVDSGQAVARHVGRVLAHHQLNTASHRANRPQVICYFTGGDTAHLDTLLKQLLPPQVSWNVAKFTTY